MHLLRVEDNPADVALARGVMAPCIEQGTLQLSTIPDGANAVAFLRRCEPYTQVASPDLVLVDLTLPGKSGYDVLAELQQDAELRYIPVVVLTSADNPEDISRCYELGANAYVVKPLELGQFLHVGKILVAFWGFLPNAPNRYIPRWKRWRGELEERDFNVSNSLNYQAFLLPRRAGFKTCTF